MKIYILHGWTKDITKWNPLIKELKSNGHQVKLLKIPGLTAKLDKPWNLSDYQAWFENEIKSERNINLIAHSFGGRVAIRFDVKNPNIIKKLILIDSAGVRPQDPATITKRFVFKTLAKIGKKITSSPTARSALYKLARESDYYQADKVLAQTMSNIVSQDQRDELQFVKAHTLIIWGSQDKTTPLSHGRLMNKTITGSTLKIIDEAGHSPHYAHPKEVANYIQKFLSPTK